jgi:hypothetical protein
LINITFQGKTILGRPLTPANANKFLMNAKQGTIYGMSHGMSKPMVGFSHRASDTEWNIKDKAAGMDFRYGASFYRRGR